METIKCFTSLEQSKKLSKILPLESADMYYDRYGIPSFIDKYVTHESIKTDKYQHLISCWSLAALLDIIRKIVGYSLQSLDTHTVFMTCELGDKPYTVKTNNHNNPIDACYEMIMRLHEHKIL